MVHVSSFRPSEFDRRSGADIFRWFDLSKLILKKFTAQLSAYRVDANILWIVVAC